MRIVPTNCLRSGMRLGKDVYGSSGELYLRCNTILTQGYINRLKSLGFNGVYIEDDISEGIEYIDIVDQKLRLKTVEKVKDLYMQVAAAGKSTNTDWTSLDVLLNGILDEMLDKNTLVYDMMDLKQFDDYTFYHCVNTAFLCIATGLQMNLGRKKLYDLALGAILHDIGKVYIPLAIINKPGVLTDQEFETMKTHSMHGFRYLKETQKVSGEACLGVLLHHERYDGNGYPFREVGSNINYIGKIIAISDVYDAITSDRPYRAAWRANEAVEYIMGNSGLRFDPEVTAAFLKKIVPYPQGTVVRLSNGAQAIVVENDSNFILRPKVRVFKVDNQNVPPYIIDMKGDRDYLDVTIQDAINI